MKGIKFLALLLTTVGVATYVWFGILQEEKQALQGEAVLLPPSLSEKLDQFEVTTGEKTVTLKKTNDFWYVIQPHFYLANQDYIEKALTLMSEGGEQQNFPFQEDHFGLNPGRAFLHFQFQDGQHKRLRVGEEAGPGNTLYVLEQDLNQVFVVHNVWGQFLYYPVERFYSETLPIPGSLVKSVKLLKQDQPVWSVSPAEKQKLDILWKGKSYSVGKAHGLWFFKKIREFQVKNFRFQEKASFTTHWTLVIELSEGNIRFDFDQEMQKISIPHFNVFADVDAYSLKSLGYELEKVIKSDKK